MHVTYQLKLPIVVTTDCGWGKSVLAVFLARCWTITDPDCKVVIVFPNALHAHHCFVNTLNDNKVGYVYTGKLQAGKRIFFMTEEQFTNFQEPQGVINQNIIVIFDEVDNSLINSPLAVRFDQADKHAKKKAGFTAIHQASHMLAFRHFIGLTATFNKLSSEHFGYAAGDFLNLNLSDNLQSKNYVKGIVTHDRSNRRKKIEELVEAEKRAGRSVIVIDEELDEYTGKSWLCHKKPEDEYFSFLTDDFAVDTDLTKRLRVVKEKKHVVVLHVCKALMRGVDFVTEKPATTILAFEPSSLSLLTQGLGRANRTQDQQSYGYVVVPDNQGFEKMKPEKLEAELEATEQQLAEGEEDRAVCAMVINNKRMNEKFKSEEAQDLIDIFS